MYNKDQEFNPTHLFIFRDIDFGGDITKEIEVRFTSESLQHTVSEFTSYLSSIGMIPSTIRNCLLEEIEDLEQIISLDAKTQKEIELMRKIDTEDKHESN
jgi:hypothetical protein